MSGWYRLGFAHRLLLCLSAGLLLLLACWLLLMHWTRLSAVTALLVLLPGFLLLMHLLFSKVCAPLFKLVHALGGTVSSYNDRDYSFAIHWPYRDEFSELVAAHNALVQAVRTQNLHLAQRELLLDMIVQHTPVSTLLCTDKGHVVFANLAARQQFARGQKLEGRELVELAQASPLLAQILAGQADGLYRQDLDSEEVVVHALQQKLSLNGLPHRLLLIRELTTELRRQEVTIWKKVIRVISHEINNSLGPIASLARSGTTLLEREQYARLPDVLQTIAERAGHLEQFIAAYAKISRLPAPQCRWLRWPELLHSLHHSLNFRLALPVPDTPAWLDPVQFEQVLINLIKNAHESGSDPAAVELLLRQDQRSCRIEVRDRGSGMSETVAAQALLPFYSTKRNGSGIGLALTREIVEAHSGRLSLRNRDGGGLCVTIELPVKDWPPITETLSAP